MYLSSKIFFLCFFAQKRSSASTIDMLYRITMRTISSWYFSSMFMGENPQPRDEFDRLDDIGAKCLGRDEGKRTRVHDYFFVLSAILSNFERELAPSFLNTVESLASER